MESFEMLETDVNDTSNQFVASVQGYPGDKFSECTKKSIKKDRRYKDWEKSTNRQDQSLNILSQNKPE